MKRENILKKLAPVLILIILILGALYYQFMWKAVQEKKTGFQTYELEDELMAEQMKAQKIKNMEKVIEEQKDKVTIVADYNNLQNEITELSRILSGAKNYQLEFDDATTDGSIIRRNIQINFETDTYASAKGILEELQNCKYRSLLRDINILAKEGGLQSTNQISVTVRVTFYEAVTEEAQMANLQEYSEGSNETN